MLVVAKVYAVGRALDLAGYLYILSVRTFNQFTLSRTCELHPLVGKCYKDGSELLRLWL